MFLAMWNPFNLLRSKPKQPDVETLRAEVRRQVEGEVVREMANRFLEALPVQPMANPTMQQHGAYALNRPMDFTTQQSPERHPRALVTVETLRTLADTYDIIRDCINHLKREVAAVPFKVVPKNSDDKSTRTKARCKEAMGLFDRKGPVGGAGSYYAHFETQVVEDVLVVGASAIYHRKNALGGWLSCQAIDAATIRPLIDAFGWTPMKDTDSAYEQWIYGVPVTRLSRQDLDYDGIHSRTNTPYFISPVEWLITVVNGALRADNWNLTWLSSGNSPDEIYSLPAEWSVESVMQFAAWWDSLLSGNIQERRKSRFLPGGTGSVKANSRKDQDFQQYELWLMRRTCAIFGVQPAAIGFAGEQYKVSQENSMDQTSLFGAGQLLAFRKAKLDDILERAGYGDLETVEATGDQSSEKEIAEAGEIGIRSGQMTPNEARARKGLQPIEGGDTLFVSNTLTPIDQAVMPPEPQPDPLPANTITEEERAEFNRMWQHWVDSGLVRNTTGNVKKNRA